MMCIVYILFVVIAVSYCIYCFVYYIWLLCMLIVVCVLHVFVNIVRFSDVRYASKYRDTPGVSGYDTAILGYQYYFYKFKFCTI